MDRHILRVGRHRRRILPTVARRAAVLMALFLASVSGYFLHTASSAAAKSPPANPLKYDKELFERLPARIQKTKRIYLGALWETPPYITVDPRNTNRPTGIVPDLAAAIGRVLGVQVVWKNLQWPAQIPSLQSGNVDALWGQINATKDRERTIADMVSWRISGYGMLVAKGNPRGVRSLRDACGLKLAVPTGSTQEQVVKGNSERFCTNQGKPAISPVPLPNAQAAVVAVKAGGADGWLDVTASVKAIVDAGPDDFAMITLPMEQVTRFVSNIQGVAVSKLQPGLTTAIWLALRRIAGPNGPYYKAFAKWNDSAAALKQKHIKINIFTGLKAGTSVGP